VGCTLCVPNANGEFILAKGLLELEAPNKGVDGSGIPSSFCCWERHSIGTLMSLVAHILPLSPSCSSSGFEFQLSLPSFNFFRKIRYF
jgi:hypothetical protein